MKEGRYLRLGSIILVRGSRKKIMIIGRGVIGEVEKVPRYFDYVGCVYPEGLIGDEILYIKHEDVDKVVFVGYEDVEDARMQKKLKEHVNRVLYSDK